MYESTIHLLFSCEYGDVEVSFNISVTGALYFPEFDMCRGAVLKYEV